MYLNSSFRINQAQPQYLRYPTYGDRLWDEKGWLDMSGANGENVNLRTVNSVLTEIPKSTTVNTIPAPTVVTNVQTPKSEDGFPKDKLLLGLGICVVAALVLHYSFK